VIQRRVVGAGMLLSNWETARQQVDYLP
jgi:hypothetical protein